MKAKRETEAIITVEDHFAEGGLGEAVCSALSQAGFPVYIMAVKKVPKSGKPDQLMDLEGTKAIKVVGSEGIPVNCTLVFAPQQALLSTKAGDTFVSPFTEMVDDYLRERAGIDFNKEDYFPAQGLSGKDGF